MRPYNTGPSLVQERVIKSESLVQQAVLLTLIARVAACAKGDVSAGYGIGKSIRDTSTKGQAYKRNSLGIACSEEL